MGIGSKNYKMLGGDKKKNTKWRKFPTYAKALEANRSTIERYHFLLMSLLSSKPVHKWRAFSIAFISTDPKNFGYMKSIPHLAFLSDSFQAQYGNSVVFHYILTNSALLFLHHHMVQI